jgi:hypothetical protein
MAAGHHLYLFLRDRLKTKNGNIFYSAFVKVVSVTSQGLLYLKDANLLSESSPDSDIIFGGEKDEWILATFPPEQQPLVRALRRAMNKYQPKKFSGDIFLFSIGQDVEFFPGDNARGWNAFITGTTMVEDIPGNHVTLFHEPNNRVVAQKIEESLKRA